MSWPSDQDYNEALQDLALNCGDALLRQCAAVRNPLGLLMPYSGNFADVYEVRGPDGRKWAVKCFKRNTPGLHARYQQIDAHLRSVKLPFTVPFAYVEQGLRIRGDWYPLVRMEWVEGQRLNDFVAGALERPQMLDQLAELWPKVAQRLQAAQVAHADLQHGNVLLVPREDGALSLKLIDYDGMYVPAFAGQRSPELGHACFQHPQRARDKLFNAEVDRFSHLVIFTALRCLRVDGKNLWQRYENGDNLLFRESDFAAPAQSELLKELWALSSRSAHAMVGRLVLATQQPLAQAPWLHEVVQGREIAPLAPADEARVNEVLRGSAAPAPHVPGGVPAAGSRPTPLSQPIPAGSRPTPLPIPVGSRGAPQPIPLGQPGNTPLPIPMPPVAGAAQPPGPVRPVLVHPSAAPRAAASPAWLAALQQHYRGNRRRWHAGLAGGAGLLLLLAAVLMLPRGENPPPVAETPRDAERGEPADPDDPASSAEAEAAEPTTTATESAWVDFHAQQTLEEHAGAVLSVAFSPDGRALASSSHDESIKLWDARTGTLRQTLTGHTEYVSCVAFSPDGQTIASGSKGGTIKLWNAATGELRRTFQAHQWSVHSVAFSVDGQTLASGGGDNAVKLWDVTTGDLRQTLTSHKHWVISVAFSPDGQTLASGSGDKTIKLWNAATGELRRTLDGHTDSVHSVVFSPDSQTLASGSYDASVKLWDVATGTLRQTLTRHTDQVRCVAFSHDGQTLASGSLDRTIKLWDSATGELRQTLTEQAGGVYSVAFSPAGLTLASGNDDASIKLWTRAPASADTTPSIAPALPPQYRLQQTLLGHTDVAECVAIRPDGRVIASGGWDQTINLWDAHSGELLQTLLGDKGWVVRLAFSPDGRLLASGGDDKVIRLWDAESFALLRELPGHERRIRGLQFTRDGQTLISGCEDKSVRFWDVATGTERATERLQVASEVTSLALSPAERRLAAGCYDGSLHFWDLDSRSEQLAIGRHAGEVGAVAFSASGELLASAGHDNLVKVWDVATGELRHTLAGHAQPVMSLAFHPGGRVVASGSMDATIIVWDVETGEQLQTLSGHTEWVSGLAFNADGTLLVSSNHDESVKLWTTQANGKPRFHELLALAGHDGAVRDVVASPNALFISTCGADERFRARQIPSGHLLGENDNQDLTALGATRDSDILCSGGADGRVTLRTVGGQPVGGPWSAHDEPVLALALAPDDSRLVTADRDELKLWNTGAILSTPPDLIQSMRDIAQSSVVHALAFSPDNQTFACGRADGQVLLFDASDPARDRPLTRHNGTVRALDFSPDGQTLASAGDDGQLRLTDLRTGESHVILPHELPIRVVAYSPDGATLVTGSDDGTLKLWDATTRALVQTLASSHGIVYAADFTPDGQILISGHDDGTVVYWELRATAIGDIAGATAGTEDEVAPVPALPRPNFQERLALQADPTEAFDAVFSPDGRHVATGGEAGIVRVWDAQSGDPRGEWKSETVPGRIDQLDFHPDGSTVAFSRLNSGLAEWEFAVDELSGVPGFTTIFDFDYASTGLLAAAGSGGRVGLHDGSLKLRDFLADATFVRALAFSRDGSRLYTTAQNPVGLKVWDVASGDLLEQWDASAAQLSDLTELALSPDERYFAAGGQASIALLDGRTGEVLRTWATTQAALGFGIAGLSFSPDGRWLASANFNGEIKLWSVPDGALLQELPRGPGVNSLEFSPDGNQLVAAGKDGLVHVWTHVDEGGATPDDADAPHASVMPPAAAGPRFAPAPLPAEVVAAAADLTVPAEYRVARTMTHAKTAGETLRNVTALAYSPDGRLLASGSEDKTVRIWEPATGAQLHELADHAQGVLTVAFHPDCRTVASGGYDQSVKLWDATTGELLQTLVGHQDWVSGLAFSPDGQMLASASDDATVKLWTVATGEVQQTLQGHAGAVKGLAFTPDGRRLVSASYDQTVKVWNLVAGAAERDLSGHAATEIAISPDGTRLATGGLNKSVILWDLATGLQQEQIEDYADFPEALAFSPNGRTLAVASWDPSLQLLDPLTGAERQKLSGGTSRLIEVAWSPAGRALATGAENGTITLWEAVRDGAADTSPPGASLTERLQQRMSFAVAAADRVTFAEAVEKFSAQTGIPVQVLVDDLKLEGITQNQTVALDERDQPAGQILRKLLLEVDVRGEVVSVVRPTADGSGEEVVVTTRAAAAARGETVTDE